MKAEIIGPITATATGTQVSCGGAALVIGLAGPEIMDSPRPAPIARAMSLLLNVRHLILFTTTIAMNAEFSWRIL